MLFRQRVKTITHVVALLNLGELNGRGAFFVVVGHVWIRSVRRIETANACEPARNRAAKTPSPTAVL